MSDKTTLELLDSDIKEILALENGWYVYGYDDPPSYKFDANSVYWAADIVKDLLKTYNLSYPRFCAIPENNLFMEWWLSDIIPSIEFNLKLKTVNFHICDVNPNVPFKDIPEYSRDYDLTNKEELDAFFKDIGYYSGRLPNDVKATDWHCP